MLHWVVENARLKIEVAGTLGVKFSFSEIARIGVIEEIIIAIRIIKVVLFFIVFLLWFVIFLFIEGLPNSAFPALQFSFWFLPEYAYIFSACQRAENTIKLRNLSKNCANLQH